MAASIKIVKMSEKATIPSKGTPAAAGFDLYSAKTITISPQTREVVSTDLKIELPRNSYGQIAPRSGLALKGLDIGAGVIDQDYRGNLKVLLINNGTTRYEVREGERVAQLLVKPILNPTIEMVEELTESTRGDRGFGSTGK